MLLDRLRPLLRYAGLVVLAAGLVALVAACGGVAAAPPSDSATAAQEEAADPTETGSGQATASYQVPTITCPSCAARVKANAEKDPGVLDTQVNGQRATVTYDPAKTDPEKIAETIRKGGDKVIQEG